MFSALRSATLTRTILPSLFSNPLPNQLLGRRSAEIRFRQLLTGPGNPENNIHKMDETEKPGESAAQSKQGNLPMSSFGEGYATRSDEEGFGGTYGGNAEEMPEQDKIVHGEVPEYDTEQGSEVKQKEIARNQHKAAK